MYKIQGATHRGMVREHNEDRYAGNLLSADYGFALVCDGMGGENGGSIASTLACEEIRRTVENSYRPELDEKTVYNILETAVSNANTIVFARANENPELSGMGTTVSLAVVCGDVCYIANVGDSRAYLLRDGALEQLTVDHTHVQALIDRGEIRPEEARTHPQRHYLTKAVGVSAQVLPFFTQLTMLPGDALLLCSDGLYGCIEAADLTKLVTRVAAGEDCQLLIDEANRRGGHDNITAVAVISGKGEAING